MTIGCLGVDSQPLFPTANNSIPNFEKVLTGGITVLDISDRLRSVREQRKLSQGDIQARTGLLRCYVSRVENGHTIPSIETLEKLARALDLPLYQLLYDGELPPTPPHHTKTKGPLPVYSHKNRHFFRKLTEYLSRMSEQDRQLLMQFAQSIATRNKHRMAT
jgi:transcriptional regulator with XRE-family HTH domain